MSWVLYEVHLDYDHLEGIEFLQVFDSEDDAARAKKRTWKRRDRIHTKIRNYNALMMARVRKFLRSRKFQLIYLQHENVREDGRRFVGVLDDLMAPHSPTKHVVTSWSPQELRAFPEDKMPIVRGLLADRQDTYDQIINNYDVRIEIDIAELPEFDPPPEIPEDLNQWGDLYIGELP